MGVLKVAIISLILAAGASGSSAKSAAPETGGATARSQRSIIGAWRLVGIDYSGPSGALADPVFGSDPQGIIIYDPSGWMSVQIVTANRPAIARPTKRTSRVVTPDDAALAAIAFDTYYAYFGTWDYDAATSVVTHHIRSSLLPYETGLTYQREATFDGDHLKLVARSQEKGEERLRTLVWSRVADSVAIAAPSARAMPTQYGDMPTVHREAIRKYFVEHLKYPDSVQYQAITEPERGYATTVTGGILMQEKREYGWRVKATINAKNSHDAYVGSKTYTFLFRGEKIVDVRSPLPGDEMN